MVTPHLIPDDDALHRTVLSGVKKAFRVELWRNPPCEIIESTSVNLLWKTYLRTVAVAWSVESLPSNPAVRVRFPARSEIWISVLDLGVFPLPIFCSVLSPAEALALCWPHIQGDTSLCICLVFWSIVCCSSTGIWPTGIWVVTLVGLSRTLGEGKQKERGKETKKERERERERERKRIYTEETKWHLARYLLASMYSTFHTELKMLYTRYLLWLFDSLQKWNSVCRHINDVTVNLLKPIR